ncbi:FAD-dependent oxidoreductase [Rhodococcus sp. IEGM 1379]|uniref:FAD-dependent oxidoreductase n=1 Tax=Rhodococcus sp. IEGM 1379 TaxID=3047086 RepID=UPI0024B65104|nr:FAD-dependent oxidoreductase [Rhodococcus sp. IEGM 1379]MDI9913830.1 FAD-dependent oxidoreductase [Rhodococcus sp. IEGM 1379]
MSEATAALKATFAGTRHTKLLSTGATMVTGPNNNTPVVQREKPDYQVDVVVVGGGPAGMTVAGDLARLGRSVAVLERWPTINPSSRAFATMARTLEMLDARGLADQLLAMSTTTPGVNLFTAIGFGDPVGDLSHIFGSETHSNRNAR